jgi:hypothetical protein
MTNEATTLDESESTVTFLNGFEGRAGENCAVLLDPEDRDVSVWNDNGTPMSVWHGRAKIVRVGKDRSLESVKDILEASTETIEQIFDAYEGSTWDGSNHQGRWNEDESVDALVDALRVDIQDNADSYWSADDWFCPARSEVVREMTAALAEARGDIDTAVAVRTADEMSTAAIENALLHEGDVEEYLRAIAKEIIADMPEDDDGDDS